MLNGSTSLSLTEDAADKATEEKNKIELLDIIKISEGEGLNSREDHPLLAASRTRPSMIYRLIGSFNGNIGRIVPQTDSDGDSLSALEDEDVTPLNSIISGQTSSPVADRTKNSDSTKVTPTLGVQKQHRLLQNKKIVKSYCPFRNIMKARDMNFHLNTSEGGEFEFNVLRNEGLYTFIKNILFDPGQAVNNADELGEKMVPES